MDDAQIRLLEFPRHMHKPSVPGAWVYTIVGNPSECARALADGWSLTPIIIGPDSPQTPPCEESSSQVDQSVAEPAPVLKPKGGWPKGKPRKVTP